MREDDTFVQDIQDILKKDCTQSANDVEGTDIRILEKDGRITITIKSGISHSTLKKLVDAKYLTHANEQGQIIIENLVIGGD